METVAAIISTSMQNHSHTATSGAARRSDPVLCSHTQQVYILLEDIVSNISPAPALARPVHLEKSSPGQSHSLPDHWEQYQDVKLPELENGEIPTHLYRWVGLAEKARRTISAEAREEAVKFWQDENHDEAEEATDDEKNIVAETKL